LAVAIPALALYSYYVRELLVGLALFSLVFLFLALVVLVAILIWWISQQLANWSGPASRRVVAFSRRLIVAHVRPNPRNVPAEQQATASRTAPLRLPQPTTALISNAPTNIAAFEE